MGKESEVRKDRTCKRCKKQFMNLSAAQLLMHAFVCEFEETLGIQVIEMGQAAQQPPQTD